MNHQKKPAHMLWALAVVATTASLTVGCVARAQGEAVAHADVDAKPGSVDIGPVIVFEQPPTIVLLDADVWVVRNYPYTVYSYGDSYWHLHNGAWYRSDAHGAGWALVKIAVVPAVIVHRDHSLYVNYTGPAQATARTGPPLHAAKKHGGPPGLNNPPGLGYHGGTPGGDDGTGKGTDEEKKDDKEEKDKKDKEKDDKKDK